LIYVKCSGWELTDLCIIKSSDDKYKDIFTAFPNFSNLFVMAQKILKTEILIKATPAIVWQILTNVDAYPDWNPFIKSVKGELVVGQNIEIELPGMNFKPKLLVLEENKELRWIGKLFLKGLFDGEHSFEIIDHRDGTVTFKQEEIFNGILVGLFSKKLDRETKADFIAMNEALKVRAEKVQSEDLEMTNS